MNERVSDRSNVRQGRSKYS